MSVLPYSKLSRNNDQKDSEELNMETELSFNNLWNDGLYSSVNSNGFSIGQSRDNVSNDSGCSDLNNYNQ